MRNFQFASACLDDTISADVSVADVAVFDNNFYINAYLTWLDDGSNDHNDDIDDGRAGGSANGTGSYFGGGDYCFGADGGDGWRAGVAGVIVAGDNSAFLYRWW